MLRKANQKRSLDDIVIQKGEFDWRTLFSADGENENDTGVAIQKALGEFEDVEDAHAAMLAAKEAAALEGEDKADFADMETPVDVAASSVPQIGEPPVDEHGDTMYLDQEEEQQEEETSTVTYMLAFVLRDYEYFADWKTG